jgi:hypothetical protein
VTGFPDSILTVLVITRLTTSQPGPLHPATVTGRKAHNAVPVSEFQVTVMPLTLPARPPLGKCVPSIIQAALCDSEGQRLIVPGDWELSEFGG